MTSKVPAADTDRSAPAEVPWHALPEGELYRRVGSAPDGLSGPAAARRMGETGGNVRVRRRRKSWWAEFAESFTEPLQLLLVSVAVLSFVFGQRGDGFAILGVILLSAAVETASEIRAARAISALDDLSAPHARVRRGGVALDVPADQVVPGDVLLLDAGDVVAADARVMAAHGLRVDESALTGEAVSAGKSATTIGSDVDLAERANMVYQGTFVVDGQARAVVVATGSGTELGRLGDSVAAQRPPATPLQAAMAQLARLVLVLAVLVSVAVPVLGVASGQPVKDMILTGLTLAFATVPEELPILVTVLLAVGGLQLARRGAILRRLGVGETLGSVTYLLTDKTGTLTENTMLLAAVHGNRDRVLSVAYAAQGADSTSTDPMDAAVAAAAHAAGIVPPGELVKVWPFDADRKRVSRLWRTGRGGWLAVAGAPESVAARCGGTDLDRWAAQAETEAADGRRCIAVASRSTPLDGRPGQERADGPVRLGEPAADDAEHGLSMEGLLVFEDPLRTGVPAAVAELIGAGVGVATIVVTGDHPSTGRAVATSAGLLPAADRPRRRPGAGPRRSRLRLARRAHPDRLVAARPPRAVLARQPRLPRLGDHRPDRRRPRRVHPGRGAAPSQPDDTSPARHHRRRHRRRGPARLDHPAAGPHQRQPLAALSRQQPFHPHRPTRTDQGSPNETTDHHRASHPRPDGTRPAHRQRTAGPPRVLPRRVVQPLLHPGQHYQQHDEEGEHPHQQQQYLVQVVGHRRDPPVNGATASRGGMRRATAHSFSAKVSRATDPPRPTRDEGGRPGALRVYAYHATAERVRQPSPATSMAVSWRPTRPGR